MKMLPAVTLVDLALDLRLAACRQAMAAEAMEFFVLKSETPELETVLMATRREAANLGALHDLLCRLAPHEAEFRRLLTDFLASR